jgi:predicted signal transduction protein with EAL and GGDEF domain
MTESQTCPTPTIERRFAFERRRRVAEMSDDEMRRALLISEVTGLPNRRAFEERGPAIVVAISDVDGLKALNKYGYSVGDAILTAKADALREAGLEAYHDKGDEFLCRGVDAKDLTARLECSRGILRNRAIKVNRTDGTVLWIEGADFSYGIGRNLEEAELSLRNHKAEREARGEVSRGQLCGISIRSEHRYTIPRAATPENKSYQQLLP